MNMILEGPNIKHQHRANTKAAISISQLLIFNSVKHARAAEASATSHALERETPLPLYLAMKIHAVTRKRTLIDTLFHWGICASCDRLLKVISDISDGVCEQFAIDGVACPPKLRTRVFPQQWLTTLIIIPLLQQQQNPSMALVFPSSSICVISQVGVVMTLWLSMHTDHPLPGLLFHSHQSIPMSHQLL